MGKLWTKQEIKLLGLMYVNNSRYNILKQISNRSWEAVKLKATRLGLIKRVKGELWTKSDTNKLIANVPVCNRESLIKLFPKREWKAILSKIHVLKLITYKDPSEMTFLLNEVPEAYYWAGFLMADGSFEHNTGRIRLCLSIKDSVHLKKFALLMNSKCYRKDSPYYFSKSNNGISKQIYTGKTDIVTFRKIIKKFNFNFRKTYNPPINLVIKNNDHFTAFLIGYIDGDGYISTNGQIGIKCHGSWKKILNNWFNRIFPLLKLDACYTLPLAKITKDGMCLVQVNNSVFGNYLKNKAIQLKLPYLRRKWNRVIKRKSYQEVFARNKHIKKLFVSGKNPLEISKKLKITLKLSQRVCFGWK